MNDLPMSLPDLPVNSHDFDQACREAGFVIVNAKTLGASAIIGEAFKRLGAVKLGRTRYLLSGEQNEKTFRLCEQLLTLPGNLNEEDSEGEGVSIKNRIEVLKLMAMLSRGSADTGHKMVESAKVDLSDSAKPSGRVASFLPKTNAIPAVAVQLNIGGHKSDPPPTCESH